MPKHSRHRPPPAAALSFSFEGRRFTVPLGRRVRFDHAGLSYTVTVSMPWALGLRPAVATGHPITVMKAIVGAEQWAAFRKRSSSVADVQSLAAAFRAALADVR